ncbi:LANO_0B03664g1_1 [Lachancea nothofagi CBS 11611]|uniref:LANO_0B03664g1_1 n=1 Tax=Lachancea nothofagi CBS 11611 TaxID=1266666 RepID=A0A1G4IWV6_9SACH|nr:LANO_0B03664g1_1 [Lachancea nothofagi CBS 11611]
MSSPTVRKALASLLRDPANGNCADCKTATHPRWASWSLGVFICIRCAGIHRSLGTHISKVKSVDLDTWQEEHLRKVVEFGNNGRANAYYEAKLQDKTPNPSKLADFIRSKYELKRWEGTGASCENVEKSDLSTSQEQGNPRSVSTTPAQPLQQTSSQASLPSKNVSSWSGTSSQVDLNLATPRPSSRNGPREVNGRPDLKKSILSLYSKPRNSTASVASGHSSVNSLSSTEASSVASNATPSASLEDNELFRNVWS